MAPPGSFPRENLVCRVIYVDLHTWVQRCPGKAPGIKDSRDLKVTPTATKIPRLSFGTDECVWLTQKRYFLFLSICMYLTGKENQHLEHAPIWGRGDSHVNTHTSAWIFSEA